MCVTTNITPTEEVAQSGRHLTNQAVSTTASRWPAPARNAGLANLLLWVSLVLSLALAFVITVPVNRWLISRGKGHGVVHEFHH